MRRVRLIKRAKRRQQDEQTAEKPVGRSAARPAHADLLSRIHELLRDSPA